VLEGLGTGVDGEGGFRTHGGFSIEGGATN
jgi:hypothetical protein